jgi:hypothetical protein
MAIDEYRFAPTILPGLTNEFAISDVAVHKICKKHGIPDREARLKKMLWGLCIGQHLR